MLDEFATAEIDVQLMQTKPETIFFCSFLGVIFRSEGKYEDAKQANTKLQMIVTA